MRPDPVRVSGWRVFIRDLLSLPPLGGRLFIRLFYNVISTGVRTIVRTKRRNPPRERYLFVYTSSVFPSGRLPRRFAPRNDSGVKGVRLVCYPCALVLVSIAEDFSAVSHRGRAGWRVFVSDISLPGDCHVAATFRLVGIATSPLWLKTVTCGLLRRTPRGKALKRRAAADNRAGACM